MFRVLYSRVIQQQIKLRENAIAQSNVILDYKRAVLQANAAETKDSTKKYKKTPTILSTIVALLAEPLAKKRKTEADHLVIELVLHFIRNLLCAEPVIKLSREAHESHIRLQEELIAALHDELVLEVILVLSQHLDDHASEDAHYNLLLMEITHHLIKNQDPVLVAKYGMLAVRSVKKQMNPANTEINRAKVQPLQRHDGSSSLRSFLSKERQRIASNAISTTRHSNFGGTLIVQGPDGKKEVLSSVLQSGGEDFTSKRDDAPKRCTKRITPFISESRDYKNISTSHASDVNPTTRHAYQALHEFSTKFILQGYKPLMKSLKNEFRRDSVRLEAQDKIVFFRLVWFFSKWQRVTNMAKKSKTASSSKTMNDLSGADEEIIDRSKESFAKYEHLVITMDLFTFQMVLQACDTYILHKKYHDLAQAVSLYLEMMHILLDMHNSKDEVENVMSIGIQHKLFYENEPLDRLPKLLREWQPGTHSREYSSDLVELSHLTLKLLELNCNASKDSSWEKAREVRRQKKKKKPEDSNTDKVTSMKKEAAEFDFMGYLGTLASHKIVGMYTSLLSKYETNSPHINHHIVAFLLRLCKFVVRTPVEQAQTDEQEKNDSSDAMDAFNQMCNRVTTLEPMLYDIRLFTVLNDILNDNCIRGNPDFTSLRQFSGTIIRHFAEAARLNPLLYVEILFKHSHPATFCERVINSYADDDLRMLVERELLRKELLGLEGGDIDGQSAAVPNDSGSDTSEGEWEEDENPRSAEPFIADQNLDGKSKDRSSIRMSSPPEKNDSESESRHLSDSEVDDRWNDRRKFSVKRKDRTLNKNDDDSISPQSVIAEVKEKENREHPKKGKRIRRLVDSDNSESETEFGVTEDVTQSATQSSRLVFDNGDEDDE